MFFSTIFYLKRKDPKQKALKKKRQSVGKQKRAGVEQASDAQNPVSAQTVCDAQATPKTHTTKKYQSKTGGSPVNPQRVKIGEFSSCVDNSNSYVLTTTNSADTICKQ